MQEKLDNESKAVIQDLLRLDDKRGDHDRYVSELNGVTRALREQTMKLEDKLESLKKQQTNSQTKIMRMPKILGILEVK